MSRVSLALIILAGCSGTSAAPPPEAPNAAQGKAPLSPTPSNPTSTTRADMTSKQLETRRQIERLLGENSLSHLLAESSPARASLERIDPSTLSTALRAIIHDEKAETELRDRASGLMLRRPGIELEAKDRELIAQLYAKRLTRAANHNEWGLPDHLSATSRRLLDLGPGAVLPALQPLLDDQRPLSYEGSEEPTLSEMRGYRVADLAGSLVARLLDEPFPASADLEERDEALEKLRVRVSR